MGFSHVSLQLLQAVVGKTTAHTAVFGLFTCALASKLVKGVNGTVNKKFT